MTISPNSLEYYDNKKENYPNKILIQSNAYKYNNNLKNNDWLITNSSISYLLRNDSTFKPQELNGNDFNENDHVTFKSLTPYAEFRFRFYNNIGQNLLAYMPSLDPFEENSFGKRNISILHEDEVIGLLKLEYLIAHPSYINWTDITPKTFDITINQWIGHRGTGIGLRDDLDMFENNVKAYNHAHNNGANMVELDVSLSKDLIPVIYHNFERKFVALTVSFYCVLLNFN